MKLLFENWRQYLNENLSKKEIEQAISDASFNSAQSSQHRWGRGQPIIDYADTHDGRIYTATYPDGTENSDLWPSRESKPGEDLETFLKRAEEPIQINLVEEAETSDRSYEQEAELDGLADFKDDGDRATHWETFEGGKYLQSWKLGYDNAAADWEMDNYYNEIDESLYYGTSTVFQEEIAKNGIKSPSKWGDYGFAEQNAMKIVEKHGGEPAVIQIPLSEFKDEYFLLDESDNATIVYTEDFHIFMEKQEKKVV